MWAMRRHQPRLVLVVGMEHDDDVRARPEGQRVAGLLVAAVAMVAPVEGVADAQPARDLTGLVRACVIHDDDLVDQRPVDPLEGARESPRGIKCWKDHANFRAVDHREGRSLGSGSLPARKVCWRLRGFPDGVSGGGPP